MAQLQQRKLQIIVVSSGAISMGMDRLKFKKRPTYLPDKQACAAVGQIRLMSVYEQEFQRFGIATAQILLTEDDFANRVTYLNLRNTLGRLLDKGVIPIVNENDTVSTSEIETAPEEGGGRRSIFGDNDRLSALVTSKLGADLLVLLSDVDGLYPPQSAAALASSSPRSPLSVVREITAGIEAMAEGGNTRGRGGMQSKLQSIKVALESGGLAVIANGTAERVLQRILEGEEVGTIFLPKRRIGSKKRWIAYASAPAGKVVVNSGARDAVMEREASLLFAGVVRVESDFKRGDVVRVVDEAQVEFARGIVNYSAQDSLPLLGKRSTEIGEISGKNYEELITRDNIVLTE
jgi:glutamate 5-kinase